MPSRSASPHARRLRWALLIALALHVIVLLRYAPALFERFSGSRQAAPLEYPLPEEQVVEITPPPAPPKSRGMVLATRLGSASPETLQTELPPGFFDKPKPIGSGLLQLAGDLDFARASGLQIVANIVPAATRLPRLTRVGEAARAPRQRPATAAATAVTAPMLPGPEPVDTTAPSPEPVEVDSSQESYVLAAPGPVYDLDAVIARAAIAAEENARSTGGAPPSSRSTPDYRAMLPQGPVVAAPPLPLGGNRRAVSEAPATDPGVGTEASGLPPAIDLQRVAPEQGKALAAARQQFLGTLTARLKASNVGQLAAAVKAGPKVTVRMKFLVDRSGQVLEVSPAEPMSRPLAERAAAVILAARLPRVPEAMTQVPVELSYPIEVYR